MKEKEESDIQNEIMSMLFQHPHVVFAYVTTTGRFKGRGGHWFTVGKVGMHDILGMLKDGRFFSIEVKKPGEQMTQEQKDFETIINKNHGVSGVATSVSQAMDILEGAYL